MAMPAGDLVVRWSMKQEKKRIIVDYDCFHAFLSSIGELPSRKTTFKVGESIGINGLWTFYLKHERVWDEADDSQSFDFDTYAHGVSGCFVLNPASTVLPGAPSTIKAKVLMIILSLDDNSVLADKDSEFIEDPFKEFRIHNAFSLPANYYGLKLSKIPERIRVIIDITVYADEAVCSVKEQTERTEGFVQDLLEDLEMALTTGNATDVTVMAPKINGSSEYYVRQVHKSILAARSKVFERMFSTETGMLEGKTGEVLIEDITPRGLDIFLKFIYTGKIVPEWPEFVEDLVNAAEKYEILKLKQFLDEKLISICKPENVFELYTLAKKFGLSKGQIDIAEFARKDVNIFSSIFGNI